MTTAGIWRCTVTKMKTDIAAAEAGLARARALPDDALHKATLINHWAGELKKLRIHMAQDRRARSITLRFYRAQRKAAV